MRMLIAFGVGLLFLGCSKPPVTVEEKVTYIAPTTTTASKTEGMIPFSDWKMHNVPIVKASAKFPTAPSVRTTPNFKTQWGTIADHRAMSKTAGVEVEIRLGEFQQADTANVDLKEVIRSIQDVEKSFKGTDVRANGELTTKYGSIPTATYARDGLTIQCYWVVMGRRLYTLRFTFADSLQLQRTVQEWFQSIELER